MLVFQSVWLVLGGPEDAGVLVTVVDVGGVDVVRNEIST